MRENAKRGAAFVAREKKRETVHVYPKRGGRTPFIPVKRRKPLMVCRNR